MEFFDEINQNNNNNFENDNKFDVLLNGILDIDYNNELKISRFYRQLPVEP